MFGKFGVCHEVTRRAVHGNGDARPHKAVHFSHFLTRRVAGHMDRRVLVGDQDDLAADQPVLHAGDSGFVPRYLARGEYNRITRVEGYAFMGARRDLGHGGTRFALRAGTEDDNILARQKLDIVLGHEIGKIAQIADFLCRRNGAPDGATDNGYGPVVRLRRPDDRLDAGHIAGKTGNGHPALCLGDHLAEPGLGLGLGCGASLDHGVGRIADHGKHALVANLGQTAAVGVRAKTGRFVEFPVSSMQDGAGIASDGERRRIGNGMRHADHFDGESADILDHPGRKLDQRNVMGIAVFGKLPAEKRQGEGAAIDRAAKLGPHIGNGTEMVLMPVGQHEAGKLFAPRLDEAEVRKDHVDPGHAVVGEGDSQIDHQPASLIMIEVRVHADLAGAAQRYEQEVRRSIHGLSVSLVAAQASVARVNLEKSADRQVRIDGGDAGQMLCKKAGKSAGGDRRYVLAAALLVPKAAQQSLDHPYIAPEDAGFHCGHGIFAKNWQIGTERSQLKPRQLRRRALQRLDRQGHARRDDAALICAVRGHQIQCGRRAEIQHNGRQFMAGHGADSIHQPVGAGLRGNIDVHIDA